ERSRQVFTISIRDLFSSNSRNHTYAALDSAGAETWHTLDTPPWTGYTAGIFALQNNKTTLHVQATSPQSQTVTKDASTTSREVMFLGETSGGPRLYRYFGSASGSGSANGAPVANADS